MSKLESDNILPRSNSQVKGISGIIILVRLQADVDAAVKSLLSLKVDYKSATGKDWKPGQAPPAAEPAPAAAPASASGASALDLHNKIVEQGNAVRDLKGKKASKVRQL